MLTTFDNPYDPFTQWVDWYHWDLHAGYFTTVVLSSVVDVLPAGHSEAELYEALEKAIGKIVDGKVSNLYRKVKRGDLPALLSPDYEGDSSASTDD